MKALLELVFLVAILIFFQSRLLFSNTWLKIAELFHCVC